MTVKDLKRVCDGAMHVTIKDGDGTIYHNGYMLDLLEQEVLNLHVVSIKGDEIWVIKW